MTKRMTIAISEPLWLRVQVERAENGCSQSEAVTRLIYQGTNAVHRVDCVDHEMLDLLERVYNVEVRKETLHEHLLLRIRQVIRRRLGLSTV